jgi:hypothetical protein
LSFEKDIDVLVFGMDIFHYISESISLFYIFKEIY